jgi:CheY-like chemotaxis protein/HPt (histidine-containing phosphotransfer) domain-containing protein
VKQVLMNLLGNAIKFTDRGEIRLKVLSETRGESCVVIFEVTDTGIGLTREQVVRLFQAFAQADDSTTRRFGGTGLGLTISQRFAELLGGELTVDSLSGVGSVFRVTIDGGPAAGIEMLHGLTEAVLAPPSGSGPNKRIRLSGRILLAEDGPDNQQLISLHLRKAGAEVVIAGNGRIAVDLVKSELFDLILMDMQMPELDGYAATSELRSRGYQLPIIALTAHAMAEDRGKCMAAGCTDYLTKPIEKQTLLTAVAGYLPGSVITDAESGSAPIEGVSQLTHASLKSTLANDIDMTEAIEEFVATLPCRVALMNQLLTEQNFSELRCVMHQMKGAGGGYGFDAITQLAGDAERAMKEKESPEKIEAGTASLIALVRSVEGYQPAGETSNA